MPRPKTFHGGDALASALGHEALRGVRRPLVISGASRRHVESVESALREALDEPEVRVFDGARTHVPRATVVAATAALQEHAADAMISVGGGSATGLGKALRLEASVPFVAVPSTYAGSEMTRIYGITDGDDKQTGRDDRVRPDAVAYLPDLLSSIPPVLAVQSVCNALAHPISALAGGELDDAGRRGALAVAERVFRCVVRMAERPESPLVRAAAARDASDAAEILDTAALGMHHKVAHRLGGYFKLPHAALHSILLPHFVAALRDDDPELYETLCGRLPEADPLASLFDALREVGAPTALTELEVDAAQARAVVTESFGELPWVEAALLGRRPSVHVRRVPWEHGAPLSVYGSLESATDVVLAVHGRGATADAIVQRAREVLGDAPGFAVVAPQAPDNRWYATSYREARQHDALATAAALLGQARAWISERAPAATLHLLGFSQGACLAVEVLRRPVSPPWRSVVAIAGAEPGPPDGERFGSSAQGVPVLLGVARGDSWLTPEEVEATAARLREAGAVVEWVVEPGGEHQLHARQRVAAREQLTGGSLRPVRTGLGAAHESEALPQALPRTHNSPRTPKYGLHPEQLSGTGFVAERHANLRTWVYRIRPAAGRPEFRPLPHDTFVDDYRDRPAEIDLVGHRPLPLPEDDAPTDFIDGMHTYGGQGSPALRRGYAIHLYAANRSMEHRAFYDADGDLLFVPEHGALTLLTELGVLDVPPGHIAMVPRGVTFSVLVPDGGARGYVAEVFGRHFELPDRGVVGANGLADERHFRVPTAWFEERPHPAGYRVTAKLGGRLYDTAQPRSPYDVAAWHGNYVPWVYDLADFSPVSNVRVDHIDPSAYLVVGAPMDERGADSLDFVAFPPRWDVTERTFRPPFFHRNAITEFNGIVREPGTQGPLRAGASFLTPSMTPHGVMARSVEHARGLTDEVADRPHRFTGRSLWFQFETALPIALSSWAVSAPTRHEEWPDVWGRHRSFYAPDDS